jgi:hypothetical protein
MYNFLEKFIRWTCFGRHSINPQEPKKNYICVPDDGRCDFRNMLSE